MKKAEINKKTDPPIDMFDDISDNEFLEAIEFIELMKKKEITSEELKKLEYIRKSRENVIGGDA